MENKLKEHLLHKDKWVLPFVSLLSCSFNIFAKPQEQSILSMMYKVSLKWIKSTDIQH